MTSLFSLILSLIVFWLLLSGHYVLLTISLGAVSCIGVTLIAKRMGITTQQGVPVHRVPLKLIPYWIWLIKEIFVSSWTVGRMILSRDMNLHVDVGQLPVDGMNDFQKVLYANSITLTPGTLTLEVSDNTVEVHTVRSEMLDSLRDDGVMPRKVRAIKSGKYKAS